MKVEAQESIIHGTGLFAIEDIAKDEFFIEYTGSYLNEEELWQQFHADYGNNYVPGSLHVWAFEVREGLYIDGDHPDNIAKYANHSCEGNCEAVTEEDRIWLQARQEIQSGEEITFDYRFPLRDFLYHPCCCGSTQCCGYIVASEERSKLRKILHRQAPGRFSKKAV